MSSTVTKLPARDWSTAQYALIRRTVAAGCNDQEFDLFCHAARHLGLDPLRRQIYAFVHSKNDAEKRKLSIVVGIDGLRTIAARTGEYRPDENPPVYQTDESLKGQNNPLGLVKCSLHVFKRSHGEWFPVAGEAYWEEFAPLTEAWAYNQETNRREPTGQFSLDPKSTWSRMPRLMLAKCAEAAALRRGWPDDLGQVYVEEELDRAKTIDLLPSEAAAAGETEQRLERIGGRDTVLIQWRAEEALVPVKVGQLADNILAFIRTSTPEEVASFSERNRFGLREFWARAPSDALEVKKAIEAAVTQIGKAEGDAD